MGISREVPKALRNLPASQVPVRVTSAAVEGLYASINWWTMPTIDAGWHAMSRECASVFLHWCQKESPACRDDPLPRGQRLAMRRLAEQLEAKLAK